MINETDGQITQKLIEQHFDKLSSPVKFIKLSCTVQEIWQVSQTADTQVDYRAHSKSRSRLTLGCAILFILHSICKTIKLAEGHTLGSRYYYFQSMRGTS